MKKSLLLIVLAVFLFSCTDKDPTENTKIPQTSTGTGIQNSSGSTQSGANTKELEQQLSNDLNEILNLSPQD